MSDEYLYQGEYSVATPFGVLTFRDGGREFTFKLHSSIPVNEHHKALFAFVKHLIQTGAERVNCDHVSLPGMDRTNRLQRGSRVLDAAAYRGGRILEYELKTKREIWLETTHQQLKEMERHCENLILLVPREEIETTTQLLKSLALTKIKVDTYEV